MDQDKKRKPSRRQQRRADARKTGRRGYQKALALPRRGKPREFIHSFEQLLEAVSLLPEGEPSPKTVAQIEVTSLSLPTPTTSTLGGTFMLTGPETIRFTATPRGWRASVLVQFDDFEIVPELKNDVERALNAEVTLGRFEGNVARVVLVVPYKAGPTATVETAPPSPPPSMASRKRRTGGLNNIDLGAAGRSIKDDLRQQMRRLNPFGESLAEAGKRLGLIDDFAQKLNATGMGHSVVDAFNNKILGLDAVSKVQGIADAASKVREIMGPVENAIAMQNAITGPTNHLTAMAEQLTASQRWVDQMLPARSSEVELVRMAEKALEVSKPIRDAMAAVESFSQTYEIDIDVTAGAAIEAATAMAKLGRPAVLEALESSATMKAISAMSRPMSAAAEMFKVVSDFDDLADPFREIRETREALRSPVTQLRDGVAALRQHPLMELQESLHEAISPKALRDAISPKALHDAISPAHLRRRLADPNLGAVAATKKTPKKSAPKRKPNKPTT